MALDLNVCTTSNISLCKVSVPHTATIIDVKKAIEKMDKNFYIARQALRTDIKGKDVDNNRTVASLGLHNDATIYVKDLGPQIGWRTVYIFEYLGPPIIYSIFACRPSLFYHNRNLTMSLAARLSLVCWIFHYSKRLYESIFVHRFSHGTMPIKNLYRNCAYYWGFAAYIAVHINHPYLTPPPIKQILIGTIIFTLSEIGNLNIHLLLRDLRPPGTTIRKIPMPTANYFTKLYNYVSCPNYTYEAIAWMGFFLISNCIPVLIFALAGMYQMTIWALSKHKAYKKEFENYPNRKAIIPFIL